MSGAAPALLTKSAVAERADALMPQYREIIATIPPEAGFGGIWESEMFLFYATIKPFAPKQILESGRARGKSTLILARCFPDARIISVEFDRQSENAVAAEAKLRPCANVELLYGDSREILPERLQNGDAILIDGPKDFRALKLGLDLMRTGKPSNVFIHDFPPNSPPPENRVMFSFTIFRQTRRSENSSSATGPTLSSAMIRYSSAFKVWMTSAIPAQSHSVATEFSFVSRRHCRRRIFYCDFD